MTQFILIERTMTPRVDQSAGLVFSGIPQTPDFLANVAREYFGEPHRCQSVTDPAALAEPLVDAIWEAQTRARSCDDVPLMQLLRQLASEGKRFVCWCGSDYMDLPTVSTWTSARETILAQTSAQPAELYIQFEPPA